MSAAAAPRTARPAAPPARLRGRPAGDRAGARRAPARPALGLERRERRARARRAHRRDRRDAGGAGGRRGRRGRGPARLPRPSSTRTCTCARPGARTRRTSTPARAPRPPAASARSSPSRTPTRWWTRRRCCARCASARAPRRASPTGFLAAITVGQGGERLTEMAELADAGAAGFTDDGLPVRSAGVMRQALQYQRLAGRVLALHEEDPVAVGRRRDARGRGVGAARRGRDPVGVRVDDGGARLRARAVRGGADPRAARVRARDRGGDRARQGGRHRR